MGATFSAEVKLDHDVFYPGNLVTGSVSIKVEKPMKCVGARICLRGDETAHALREPPTLSVAGTNGFASQAHHVIRVNTFLEETLTLFGPPKGSEAFTTVELGHGIFTYPFKFQLPMHIPGTTNITSFSGGGVTVEYHVDAVIQLHAEEFKNFKHSFQVVTPINADALDKVASPVAKGSTKLSTFLHDKGACDFVVALDRGIYCGGGDHITGAVEIDNTNGQIPVEHLKVHLQCRVDSIVHDSHFGPAHDCHGVAVADPIINHKLKCNIPAGGKGTVSLKEALPSSIHYASYPDKGEHYKIKHILRITVEHGHVDIPVLLAHSVDNTNSQQYMPPGDVATKPHNIHEYAYDMTLHETAHPIHGVKPDPEIPAEKVKSPLTVECPGITPAPLKLEQPVAAAAASREE